MAGDHDHDHQQLQPPAAAGLPRLLRAYFWQLVSLAAYAASLLFQDRVLRRPGGGGQGLADLMALATLAATAALCYRGAGALRRGPRVNGALAGLSVLVAASTVMTMHGQGAAGVMARVLFKSGKVIPTSALEAAVERRAPAARKLAGCAVLTAGSALYFVASGGASAPSGGSASFGSYTLGVLLLLGGTLADSALTVSEKVLFFGRDAPLPLTVVEAGFGCAFWGVAVLALGGLVGAPFAPALRALAPGAPGAAGLAADLALFCAASSVSYVLTFHFISSIGALYADSFKAFRKVAVVVAFAAAGAAPVTPGSVAALGLCGAGLWLVETGYAGGGGGGKGDGHALAGAASPKQRAHAHAHHGGEAGDPETEVLVK